MGMEYDILSKYYFTANNIYYHVFDCVPEPPIQDQQITYKLECSHLLNYGKQGIDLRACLVSQLLRL